jgi:hypothetical protein
MIAAASWWTAVAQHAGSFLFGLLIGLAMSSRYRIVRVPENP